MPKHIPAILILAAAAAASVPGGGFADTHFGECNPPHGDPHSLACKIARSAQRDHERDVIWTQQQGLARFGAVSGLAAEPLAARLRCGQPRFHALADQVALELSDPRKLLHAHGRRLGPTR